MYAVAEDDLRGRAREFRAAMGDGEVVFFTGSPAMMQLAMSYSEDRIRGLGDMPLALLREKAR